MPHSSFFAMNHLYFSRKYNGLKHEFLDSQLVCMYVIANYGISIALNAKLSKQRLLISLNAVIMYRDDRCKQSLRIFATKHCRITIWINLAIYFWALLPFCVSNQQISWEVYNLTYANTHSSQIVVILIKNINHLLIIHKS